MVNIDVNALLSPLSEESPCGENLEYDPAFGELERAAQGTPERVSGDEVIPPEEPKWNEVFEKAAALAERTKDLRVAGCLLHAGLRVGGLPVFSSGLVLVHRLASEYWDTVHPQLDKDDNDDPTLRMNSLLILNGRDQVVGSLSRCPLVHSKALGRVSMRDIRIASGEAGPGAGDPVSPLDSAQIDAAFLDGELDELKANAEAAQAAFDELTALTAYLNEQVGVSLAPDLSALAAELRAVRSVLAEQLGRRGIASAEGGSADVAQRSQAVAVGEIKSRDDVVRILDRICEYFQRNEPSSPVPLLLRRAKGLVAKDFMEILNDLTPDGVSQAKLIGGLAKDD
jgi:type VI secretion system protein ImpA